MDTRSLPYPVTPDSKCVFIGKSPRSYTLTRYAGTSNETIISQYFDSTGTFVSQNVPLSPLTSENSSWYLPRSNISVVPYDNEEIALKVFDESGAEVYAAKLFAKQSAVVNEEVLYAPQIVGITVGGNQKLTNGNFYVYEKQDFNSLGLYVTLVYSDGTTSQIPVDGTKCIMYGQNDFISSYAGLTQNILIKYFRSNNESISPAVADATGNMIAVTVPVTVIPNGIATTAKIVPLPVYNSSNARYAMRYYIYFGDGRSHIDVSGDVTFVNSNLYTDTTYFGVTQTVTMSLDMSVVLPATYPTSTIHTQTLTIQFNAPTSLVKWWFSDSTTSPFVYGLDNSTSRRPLLKYDSTINQYFIPSGTFGNTAAFLNSFYTQASPPYDPTVSQIPQVPTHFTIRDLYTGQSLVSGPIPIANYATAFNLIESTNGIHSTGIVIVEFINVVSSSISNVLLGVPVDTTTGTYV